MVRDSLCLGEFEGAPAMSVGGSMPWGAGGGGGGGGGVGGE